MEKILRILEFIVEIEKLKDITRHTRPVGLNRYENSAEHSWHVCLLALALEDYANAPVDTLKVIKMLLIHDLGEIDAGDTIVYHSDTLQRQQEEKAGVERLFNSLPDELGRELIDVWLEFEAGKTAEARYAKAIDRIPPLLHNLHDDGHSWKKHGISKRDVMTLNGERISKGSAAVWEVLQGKLEQAAEQGLLR